MELSVTGIARMNCNLLWHPGVARGLTEWVRLLKKETVSLVGLPVKVIFTQK